MSFTAPIPNEGQSQNIESQQGWWRASLIEANTLCLEDNMKLIASSQLRQLVEDERTNQYLPKRLPFWIGEQMAFDTEMMVPIPLSNDSEIYVLCQKV